MYRFTIALTALLFSISAQADMIGYNGIVDIETESENYIVKHHHDWSLSTSDSRYLMMSTDQNPFRPENDFAYVICIEKSSGDTIFKLPSPALTTIYISDNEKYIAGISNIMLSNPYQMAICTIEGKLLFARHIASEEAKLTKEQFLTFKEEYNSQYKYLNELGRIHLSVDHYFVDFLSMNMPNKLGDGWKFLIKHMDRNHLSPNFSQSVTNWVFWFYEEHPGFQFNYSDNQLKSASLLDPERQRFQIKLK